MLRRMKEDVEDSLEAKTETIVEVELTTVQKRCYRAIFEKDAAMLCRTLAVAGGGGGDDDDEEEEGRDGGEEAGKAKGKGKSKRAAPSKTAAVLAGIGRPATAAGRFRFALFGLVGVWVGVGSCLALSCLILSCMHSPALPWLFF